MVASGPSPRIPRHLSKNIRTPAVIRTPGTRRRRTPRPDCYDWLFNAVDQGVCVIDVMFDAFDRPFDYRFVEVNPAFQALTGLDNAVGRTMRELRPEHEQHWFDLYGRIAVTGEPERFERPAAALGRWYDVYAFRLGEPEERRLAVIFSDITKRRRDEERLELLAAEMGHRAKNLLTIVASIVRLADGDTVGEYRSRLLGRIGALSDAQTVLAKRPEHGADLSAVIEATLVALEGNEDRIARRGPPVTLPPDFVQMIAVALHELATNATKYGALSVPAGRVEIDWEHQDGRLHLRWSESGGPAVVPPAHKGLGLKVLRNCVRSVFGGGDARFDWREEGLVCELTFLLQEPR